MLEHASSDTGFVGSPGLESTSDQIRSLERRLHRGWELMARAERLGESVDDLFEHFLVLLHEYESLVDYQMSV